MTDLGALGGSYSYAFGINDLGQIVGYYQTSYGYGYNRPFLYENGVMTDLGTLGDNCYPQAINDLGQIAGYSSNGDCSRAFLYENDENGVVTSLGTLGGWSSMAYGINDRGQVVGGETPPPPVFSMPSYMRTAS